MASKTINIDAELYEKIKKLKGKMSFTEYFTELIERNTTSPTKLFGILNDDDLDYDKIKNSRVDRNVDV